MSKMLRKKKKEPSLSNAVQQRTPKMAATAVTQPLPEQQGVQGQDVSDQFPFDKVQLFPK